MSKHEGDNVIVREKKLPTELRVYLQVKPVY